MGFGKLWKLIMPLYRTWKMLGKGGVQSGDLKVLDFCLRDSKIS